MNRQKSFENNQPTLYLVATPIGNLDEMTYRSINILNEANYIAAEDTRNTVKLLNHFNISTKLISHHEHNIKQSIPKLISLLEEGNDIALVSDAGYPAISDPGYELVKEALIKNGRADLIGFGPKCLIPPRKMNVHNHTGQKRTGSDNANNKNTGKANNKKNSSKSNSKDRIKNVRNTDKAVRKNEHKNERNTARSSGRKHR